MGPVLTDKEIRQLMDDQIWGTLLAVDDGQPYGVETSFAVDETHLYTGTSHGGRMNTCIEKNPRASFKVVDGDHRGHRYRAAIVESKAEILTNRKDVLYCLKIIYTKLKMNLSTIEARADRYMAGNDSLTLYRLPLLKQSGISYGM